MFRLITSICVTTLLLAVAAFAQQDTGPIQGNAGQASQPAGVTSGPGNPASNRNGGSPTATDNAAAKPDGSAPETDNSTPRDDQPRTVIAGDSGDANAYNPILEPPALPKGKPTLIGGTATRIDHVRNLLTVEPFGSKQKIKVFLDERTHIYRNGEATTVLGIRKGDRVYVDTMLDGSRVFAKNVRVQNQSGAAEVRGQVTAVNSSNGTVTVRDELSAQPVTFAVGSGTQYSAYKGTATSADVQPGSLVDVQFARGQDKHDVAKEVILLARTGDTYVFSGVVTHIDMRTGMLALDNRSDDQTYELHFNQSAVDDRSKL